MAERAPLSFDRDVVVRQSGLRRFTPKKWLEHERLEQRSDAEG